MGKYLQYKCVVFDIDNTLYDEKEYFEATFGKISNIISKKANNKNAGEICSKILAEFRAHGSQYPKFFLHIAKLFNLNENFHETFYNIHKTVKANIILYPDAQMILDWSRKKELKLGLITNGAIAVQKNKIKLLKLKDLVNYICISRELGEEKPSIKPYQHVMKRLNTTPENTLYIGDNPHNDFEGAKKLGIRTVRLKRGEFKNIKLNERFIDYNINNFDELKVIIET